MAGDASLHHQHGVQCVLPYLQFKPMHCPTSSSPWHRRSHDAANMLTTSTEREVYRGVCMVLFRMCVSLLLLPYSLQMTRSLYQLAGECSQDHHSQAGGPTGCAEELSPWADSGTHGRHRSVCISKSYSGAADASAGKVGPLWHVRICASGTHHQQLSLMHAGPCELSNTCFFFSIGTSQAPILDTDPLLASVEQQPAVRCPSQDF